MHLLSSSHPLSMRFKVRLKRQSPPLFSTTSNIPICKSFPLISIQHTPGGGGGMQPNQTPLLADFGNQPNRPAFRTPVLRPRSGRKPVTSAATPASNPPSAHPSSRRGGTTPPRGER